MTTLRQEMLKTFKIAWPVMTGLIGQMLFNLVDTLMMGRYSTTSLAAATFVSNVQTVPLVFVFGFSTCISVLSSQAIGRRDPESVSLAFRVGTVLVSILAVALFGVCYFTSHHLEAFGQPADVTIEAQKFFILMGFSLIPLGIFQAMRQLSDSLEKTLPPTLVNFAAVGINITLNYCLVYGNWGAPELGLTGAGIGTVVARWSMVPMMWWILKRGKAYQPYLVPVQMAGRMKNQIRSCFRLGLPSALQYVFETGIFAASAVLMGWIGKEALAGHQIAINHASITFMFALGLAIATTVRVGRATGENDWVAVRRIGLSSVILASTIMTFFAALFILTRNIIPPFFVNDPKVIDIASDLFVCMAFFQLFDAAQGVLVGALRGASDVKIPTLVTFISYWVIGGVFTYTLAFKLGYSHVGVWLGLGISLFAASLFLGLRFHYLTRKKIQMSVQSL